VAHKDLLETLVLKVRRVLLAVHKALEDHKALLDQLDPQAHKGQADWLAHKVHKDHQDLKATHILQQVLLL
jgi:hypothetical protein